MTQRTPLVRFGLSPLPPQQGRERNESTGCSESLDVVGNPGHEFKAAGSCGGSGTLPPIFNNLNRLKRPSDSAAFGSAIRFDYHTCGNAKAAIGVFGATETKAPRASRKTGDLPMSECGNLCC